MQPRTCKLCGMVFEPTSGNQQICHREHFGNCPVCGKRVKIKYAKTLNPCCSDACRVKKIKQTTIDRYGVDHVSKVPSIQASRRKTFDKRRQEKKNDRL